LSIVDFSSEWEGLKRIAGKRHHDRRVRPRRTARLQKHRFISIS
jgi:hypothetical protein